MEKGKKIQDQKDDKATGKISNTSHMQSLMVLVTIPEQHRMMFTFLD